MSLWRFELFQFEESMPALSEESGMWPLAGANYPDYSLMDTIPKICLDILVAQDSQYNPRLGWWSGICCNRQRKIQEYSTNNRLPSISQKNA